VRELTANLTGGGGARPDNGSRRWCRSSCVGVRRGPASSSSAVARARLRLSAPPRPPKLRPPHAGRQSSLLLRSLPASGGAWSGSVPRPAGPPLPPQLARSNAFEERGDTKLHLLSPRKHFAMCICLLYWRSCLAWTVTIGGIFLFSFSYWT
jgi:hypothetical protein